MEKTYCVSRSFTICEYIEVEAESENEAISIANTLDDSKWEKDQFQEYKDYDYYAEEI